MTRDGYSSFSRSLSVNTRSGAATAVAAADIAAATDAGGPFAAWVSAGRGVLVAPAGVEGLDVGLVSVSSLFRLQTDQEVVALGAIKGDRPWPGEPGGRPGVLRALRGSE